jgi:aminopeptidase N
MKRTTWQRSASVVTALAVALLAVGCAPGSGQPSGGQSIGDPYFPHDGNTGYEVENYKLDLSYEPGADQLRGTATIAATTTQDLSSFSFDFGLDTSGVTVDGTPANFKSANSKLVVTPKSAIAANKPMMVAITYSGVPSKVRMHDEKHWYATPDGAGSVAEPHYAAFWYPCNDHPSNKATWDVSVSVPNGTAAISNGNLVSSQQVGDRTFWKWSSDKPLATYNSFMAIGRFTVKNTMTPDGHTFFRAYSQRLSTTEMKNATSDIEQTPDVIAWESSLFGPYPFAVEGGVAIDAGNQNDAEEFQTKPVYSDVFKHDDIGDIVHENAHQWFGDAVTPKSWKDIWLNEGFARYTEWMWDEHVGKKSAAQAADDDYKQYDSGDKFWKTAPGDPGAGNLLDDPVYERSAMTLQALRSTVGDPTFFTILQHRVSEHLYGNDSTDEFISLAERISGKSLKSLFDTWLYSTSRPANPPSAGMRAQ